MFGEAIREGFRYAKPPSCNTIGELGSNTLTTEQLWSLDTKQLNDVYKRTSLQQFVYPHDSLLGDHHRALELLDKRLAIIRAVFEVKQAEEQAKAQEEQNMADLRLELKMAKEAEIRDHVYDLNACQLRELISDLTSRLEELERGKTN